MNVTRVAPVWLVMAAAIVQSGADPLPAQQNQQAAIDRGRKLFEHKWTKNDPLSHNGDGLGPMFNAESCAACHALGGVGGAGSIAHNAQLLTVVRPHAAKDEQAGDFRKSFVKKISKVHANFVEHDDTVQASVVFHRFGTGGDYQQWRESFWGVSSALNGPQRGVALKLAQKKTAGKPVSNLPGIDGVEFILSERNTPSLFGSGLLNEIPTEVLEDVAKHQAELYPGLAGRVGRTGLRTIGRFGWRGQVDDLDDFVDTACAIEIGLEVPFHAQIRDPRLKSAFHVPEKFDLSDKQVRDLFEFVNSLPRPQQILPKDSQTLALLNHGEAMFHSVGCTACHMPTLGDVTAVYTDLLLHDMGPGLADPVPAIPAQIHLSAATTSGGAYGGGSFDVFADVPSNIRREWRTPPLWGVADSAPYLHDGRAATLDQAILLHGGEGQSSASRYMALPTHSREAILLFLSTLRAPAVGRGV